jgi:hypothetical protein
LTGQAGIAAALWTCIPEVLGLNLGRTPSILTEFFVVFLCPSGRIPGEYLE